MSNPYRYFLFVPVNRLAEAEALCAAIDPARPTADYGFDVRLASDGQEPATYLGSDGAVSESINAQLVALNGAGQVPAGIVWFRLNQLDGNRLEASNVAAAWRIGEAITFDDAAALTLLQRIITPSAA